MVDIDEIIDYIKSLKKGFDKDLFQSKIDELAHAVATRRLQYDDFHTLFKVWLNLTIPITKWTSLGACLVPPDRVEETTVEYAFRWLLANCENQTSFPRIAFVLDWLTAAMDYDCIDMKALDSGYELFYIMLSYELLTVNAIKLVYTLTKPVDVTRRRVLELLDYAKKREAKKNMYRQLQVLLGLFKSYKPECVPEDIPAISIHTAFKKINVSLLARFSKIQNQRNSSRKERHRLMWINPLNSERGRNKKVEPLVPNMEFMHIGSKQYSQTEPQKNYLDFSDPVSLVQYSMQHSMLRPARLRALLCNETGRTLLSVARDADHAFLAHDLTHLLTSCFLNDSPHSYTEKRDLLHRLVLLQRTMLQGLPIITRFLAQYLPLWNERDYYAEILDLVEWISVISPDQVQCIVEPLTKIYHRSEPIEQCAILNSLTNMYANLVYSRTRKREYFMNMKTPDENYAYVLPLVAGSIGQMCNRALQINPADMRVLRSVGATTTRAALAELAGAAGAAGGAGGATPTAAGATTSLPRALSLALPLLTVSAGLVDDMACLMMLYKRIFSALRAANRFNKDDYAEHLHTLKTYTCDLFTCIYGEEALSGRNNGMVFQKLPPQLVDKLYSIMPDVDSKLSLRNHIAFAPYTYMQLVAIDHRDADNKLWFETIVDEEFPNLSKFLRKTVPELRS